MAIDLLAGVARANDKYRAELRQTWISDPAASALQVTAIPTNLPTIITAGWGQSNETKFLATAATGDSPSNYALTGVTVLSGGSENLPENTSLNCLNHEEFFNQYEEKINEVIGEFNVAVESVDDLTKSTVTVASSATPTPQGDRLLNELFVTALAEAAEFAAPTGTVTNGNKIIMRIKDDGTARALTWNAIYDGFSDDLPSTTTVSKTLYVGFFYNSASEKWEMLALGEEA